jgi:putative membrane protein
MARLLPRFSLRMGTLGFGLAMAAVFATALFFAIDDIGFGKIRDELLAVRFGLVGLIVVHLGQLAFCALAWKCLFVAPGTNRGLTFGPLIVLRWIRESIDGLLPVAQVGGMFIAARLLAQRSVTAPIAGASVIADITIETLTQAIFTLIGLALLLLLADPGDELRWAAIGLGAAAVFAGLAILAQRLGGVRLFEKVMLALADRMGWRRLEGVAGLDQTLNQVYTLRGKLVLAGVYHLAAWSLGAGEVMIAAWALGRHIGFGPAFVIESLAQAVRTTAFFVPGAVGVQEGGFVLVAGLFGIPPDIAISISLTKRLRELTLGIPGLAAWQWREHRHRRRREKLEITPGTV